MHFSVPLDPFLWGGGELARQRRQIHYCLGGTETSFCQCADGLKSWINLMKQYVIYPDWIQDSKLKTKCSSNRQKTITTKSLLSLHGYFAGWSLHGLAACRFKTMTSTTGAYSSFSLFLFLDASNCLFFPRLSRHFVTRFQACQEKCTLDSTFCF